MRLVDTHCHIHDGDQRAAAVIKNARAAGVDRIITVGTDINNSRLALKCTDSHAGVYATVGIHPNVTTHQSIDKLEAIIKTAAGNPKLVGLGDIGLDYHYRPHDRDQQIKLFESQLDLALKYDLPVSFHVREAFDDFWPVIAHFAGLRGTLHSYTDNMANLDKAIDYGLYISLNGILTFNRDKKLQQVFQNIPLSKLLLETDAPYLTPAPNRGKLNESAYVVDIARFLAASRNCEITEVAEQTTTNATTLFSLQ